MIVPPPYPLWTRHPVPRPVNIGDCCVLTVPWDGLFGVVSVPSRKNCKSKRIQKCFIPAHSFSFGKTWRNIGHGDEKLWRNICFSPMPAGHRRSHLGSLTKPTAFSLDCNLLN